MIIPDINVIVYAHDSSSRYHPRAREWWESAVGGPERIGMSWVVVLGFVRLLSNPAIVRNPRSPADLLEGMREILGLPSVDLVVPGHRHPQLMQKLFEESGATGRLTTDVHLAALAIEQQATLASNDADLLRFHKLKLINPLA